MIGNGDNSQWSRIQLLLDRNSNSENLNETVRLSSPTNQSFYEIEEERQIKREKQTPINQFPGRRLI